MFIFRTGVIVLAAMLAIAPAAEARVRHAKASSSHSASHAKGSVKASAKAGSRSGRKGARKVAVKQTHKLRGQQAIAPERVTEIQTALIREHYLAGPADGDWDSETVAAMQKYQSDQGWQTKLMPDSRALKKLGLGADYSNAINAKTGSFGGPISSSKTIPTQQAQGFTAASGVKE